MSARLGPFDRRQTGLVLIKDMIQLILYSIVHTSIQQLLKIE